jgi:YVTN family beta-propeller protein
MAHRLPAVLLAVSFATTGTLAGQTLLVANKTDNTVDLVTIATGESRATLPTREGPHEIAVSPDGRTAVVSNYGRREAPGSSLTVIDVASGTVTGTVELGEHTRPHGLAWLDEDRLAVTTEGSAHLLVVDPHRGEIIMAVGTDQEISHMVAVTPDGRRAFVANIGSGTVTVIDLAEGRKLGDIATGEGAEGIAVTADGSEVWVTNRSADTLTVVDPATLEIVETIACESFPIRVAMTADGARALVSVARSGEVVALDARVRRETVRAKLDLSALPESTTRLFGDQFGDSPVPVGLVIAPDGRTAWVAATQADAVVVIDPENLAVKGLIKAGKEPDGMAYSPH